MSPISPPWERHPNRVATPFIWALESSRESPLSVELTPERTVNTKKPPRQLYSFQAVTYLGINKHVTKQ